MNKLEKLKSLLEMILTDNSLKPEGDVTHCNQAVISVMNAYNYYAFDGMMANQICNYLVNANDWVSMDGTQAQKAANLGQVLIAAHPYLEHGHVAMIAPGQCALSGKWMVSVPIVANVGKDVGMMAANMAFPVSDTPPTYYLCLSI